jgi:putative glutamine amidotransferase
VKPLIAVTGRSLPAARIERWSEDAVASPAGYTDAVERAGGLGVVLPPVVVDRREAGERLAQFDGLVLSGGVDVDPDLYGQAAAPETYGVDSGLDAFEIALTLAAIELDLPVLAICRGLQVVNVALGGSLDQHITGRPGLLAHGVPNGGGGVLHEVRIEPGSALAKAVGSERPSCRSHHHQVVDRIGQGLVPVAWTDDGIIEGLERPDSTWFVAVQWHPEETAADDGVQQALFDAFVAVSA